MDADCAGEDRLLASVPSADLTDKKQAEALAAAARDTLARMAPRELPAARYKVSRFDIPVALADGSSLLFNARSRSLVLLSADETRTYRGLAANPAFPARTASDRLLVQSLVRAGHVVGANVDELGAVRKDYEGRRNNDSALNLTIAPTMACNFGCGYCFQGGDKPAAKMSRVVEDRIVDLVKAKAGLKSLSVVWYGGEPLMGKESIFRLSDRLIAHCDKHKIGYRAGMVSNTYLLSAEIAAQLHTRGVRWVQVTLDGDRETHDRMRPLTSGRGSFDRILDNIGATLDETPITFNVRVNVGWRNVDKVSRMLDTLAEKNFPKRGSLSVYFAPIEASTAESGQAFGERMDRLEFSRAILELEAKARRLGLASTVAPYDGFSGLCVATVAGGFVIAPSGDVHKCWETTHDPAKRVGSIGASKPLAGGIAADLWRDFSPFDNPVCAECKILPMCGGHCAHKFVYGSPDFAALPCPGWKWNTAEYVFSRAKDLGIPVEGKWLAGEATQLAKQSGPTHSPETLEAAQQVLLAKVGARHRRRLDRAMIMAGEPVLAAAPAAERRPDAAAAGEGVPA